MERRLFLILLALTALMMVGCDERNPDGSYNTSRSFTLETIVIDNCEYINGCRILAHKGNCRFCKERRYKELEELIKQLREK